MSAMGGVVPTVLLFVSVPGPLVRGTGWAWVRSAKFEPVREYVYSSAELCAVLRGLACSVAAMLTQRDADKFTVTASGLESGTTLGRDQWEWCASTRLFHPHGEPWSVWDLMPAVEPAQQQKAPVAETGGPIRQGRFVDVLRAFSTDIGRVDGLSENVADLNRRVA